MKVQPEEILFQKDGAIATITINRPDKLNTVTAEMGRALYAIAEQINQDDEVRVVIVTGVGDRAFSAGSAGKTLDDYATNWQMRNRPDYNRALSSLRTPRLAALPAYCLCRGP